MQFGEKLKKLRLSHNLTQEELAKKIGVSLRTIKGYELGETLPRYREIYYKTVLNCPTRFFKIKS
ncbi:helix-turn-helix transcriptional regulator [Thermoanaerobacter sp. CM-CNRG TB177]|uniref:helix-turn-helix domain-containing protein n=1 Tax=Thermoanaerobacter sp. CM-CNRG TB177 TaxID=2800659 RepID=UPI001BDEEA3B|nr:helix-turn-helix transcriptional regulator [Thermoanaerobacter sp. CM-CNRG TB177]MBT1278988.1 helix-turn-helix transcriptional regulator [Thermoanaerobacter sp. CM-CNRG TB177]